jgi:hypothetical protein
MLNSNALNKIPSFGKQYRNLVWKIQLHDKEVSYSICRKNNFHYDIVHSFIEHWKVFSHVM